MDASSSAQYIVLKGLEGHDPTGLLPMQKFLVPYFGTLEYAWWIIWSCTLLYILINHVVVPFVAEYRQKKVE